MIPVPVLVEVAPDCAVCGEVACERDLVYLEADKAEGLGLSLVVDAELRELLRHGEATARHLARVGLARVVVWDGRGVVTGASLGYDDGEGQR